MDFCNTCFFYYTWNTCSVFSTKTSRPWLAWSHWLELFHCPLGSGNSGLSASPAAPSEAKWGLKKEETCFTKQACNKLFCFVINLIYINTRLLTSVVSRFFSCFPLFYLQFVVCKLFDQILRVQKQPNSLSR